MLAGFTISSYNRHQVGLFSYVSKLDNVDAETEYRSQFYNCILKIYIVWAMNHVFSYELYLNSTQFVFVLGAFHEKILMLVSSHVPLVAIASEHQITTCDEHCVEITSGSRPPNCREEFYLLLN